ncbi:MAG: threonine ammonia-lyase [Alphaproteobacteria bacterium]|nr:threonine ammonia-lyase [Alphaproteobacteria bacterium]
MAVSIDEIRAAAKTIQGAVPRTPLVGSGALSEEFGADIHLKLETLHFTGSFKDRGALVKLRSLSKQAARNGVIAASAGNHAQGVAYHAKRLGIPATIVMPVSTPFTKVNRTEALGARVMLHGDSVSACVPFAREMMAAENLTFIHPFDDPHIIAGQGTVGLEILEDLPSVDTLIVPIGGGGLAAGIATAVKALQPGVEIIGVEAALYPSMAQAVRGEKGTAGGETIAEGIAVKTPGTLTVPIVRDLVDDLVSADELTLEDAVATMAVTAKLVAEGAGAAPLAAVMAARERFAGKTVALVVSGGNIDSRMLASVLMRGLVRDGQIARLRVTISDAPGTLARVAQNIGALGGNIVEIVHQRMFFDVPVKQAEADIVVETRDEEHVEEIIAALTADGFPTRRLGDTARTG